MNKAAGYIVLLWASAMLTNCTATRFLDEGEQFYEGANIKLDASGKVPGMSQLMTTLEQVVEPTPNEKFLGSRPKVWFHHIAGEPKKEKGFKHWLKYQVGRAPVLMSEVDPEHTKNLLINRLQNNGYFNAEVEYEIKSKAHTAQVVYQAQVVEPYRINEIHYPPQVGPLRKTIGATREESLIEEGEPYRLNDLLGERRRIDRFLKTQGYFYFSPDYLLFDVDSTVGGRRVNIYLTVKGDIPYEAAQQYTLNNILIFPDYDLTDEDSHSDSDTLRTRNYRFIFDEQEFKPRVISNAIYLRKGALYNIQDHEFSINRLLGLGAFKFVNMQFRQDSLSEDQLNTNIRLTPLLKKSLRLEADLVAGSNNFVGPRFSVNFRNRNTFRGAELLMINLLSGFETQVSSQGQSGNSFEFGLETSLIIPRFISPFRIRASRGFAPLTEFELGYNYLRRPRFFTLNSFRLNYGYDWERSQKHFHQLRLVEINLVKLLDTTDDFEALLENNNFLRQSYEEQFIIGTDYVYNYRPQTVGSSQFHLKGNLNLSGNLLNLAQSLGRSAGENEVFGQTYSQYTRGEGEVRYHYRLDRRNVLASRFLVGAGFSYGNSEVLPYIKQFFSGGSSSVRGFRARSVGPGTYTIPDTLTFRDQGGDIRLEFNMEHRFDLIGMFKGAYFLDVGNIWTRVEDPQRPGSEFEFTSFFNELAVGTGLGLRVDASFFVLRFDLGFPLRKPSMPSGQRWVVDDIDILDRDWRKENLVLNIAIGYPF